MHKIIISDTSCFIVLNNIGELELLHKSYDIIITTNEVVSEFGSGLPEWVIIQSPKDKSKQKILEMQLDKGEASAIALAIETHDCSIILDDQKARKIAEQYGLEITGTIGVIIKAKKKGLITSIKPILQKLKSSGFRYSNDIELEALKEAGE